MADETHDADATGWHYPHRPELQHYMVSLMSFCHGRSDDPYPNSIEFSREELLELTPRKIVEWLNFRAYGDPNPHPEAPVTGCRSGSLNKAKSSVSVFMPNNLAAWISGVGGNPTKHLSVNNVIKSVEAKETKGLGLKANDKRPYSQAEFDKMLEILRSKQDFLHRFTFPMVTIWSYHLIH